MKKIKFFSILLLGVYCAFLSQAQTTTINGLVVIVNYTDDPFNATITEVSTLMNQSTGYTNWGNNRSVRQYYTAQTNNKIDTTSQVIATSVPNTTTTKNNCWEIL